MKAKVKLYLIIQPSPHGHHGYSKAFISMPLSCSKHGSKGVSDFLSCSYLFRLVPKLTNYQGYPITYYKLIIVINMQAMLLNVTQHWVQTKSGMTLGIQRSVNWKQDIQLENVSSSKQARNYHEYHTLHIF